MQLLRYCCRHLSAVVKALLIQVSMIYGHILGSLLAECAFVLHLINGAGRGSEDRTHAPVTRPDSLANYSLYHLSIPRKIKFFNFTKCVINIGWMIKSHVLIFWYFAVSTFKWLRRSDSNRRSFGYEPSELTAALLRIIW